MAFSGPGSGPSGNGYERRRGGSDDHNDCYYCGTRVASRDYDAHLKVCPRKKNLERRNNGSSFGGIGSQSGAGLPRGASSFGGRGGVGSSSSPRVARPSQYGGSSYKSSAIGGGGAAASRGGRSGGGGGGGGRSKMWQCDKCTFYNDWSNDICVICTKGCRPLSQDQWRCQICTFINGHAARACKMCGSRPPPGQGNHTPDPARAKPPARNPPSAAAGQPRNPPPVRVAKIEPINGGYPPARPAAPAKPYGGSGLYGAPSQSPHSIGSGGLAPRHPPAQRPLRPPSSSLDHAKPLSPSSYPPRANGSANIPKKRPAPTGHLSSGAPPVGPRGGNPKRPNYQKDSGAGGARWSGLMSSKPPVADKQPPSSIFGRVGLSNGAPPAAGRPPAKPFGGSSLLNDPPPPRAVPKPGLGGKEWRSSALDPKPIASEPRPFPSKPKPLSPASIQHGVDELKIGTGSSALYSSRPGGLAAVAPPPPKPKPAPPDRKPYAAEPGPPPLEDMKVDEPDQKESVASSPMEMVPPPVKHQPPPPKPSGPESHGGMDEATRRLIEQMQRAELCTLCGDNQGHDVGTCGHRICERCGRKHLEAGVKSERWASELVRCPVKGCKTTLPEYLWRRVGLSDTTYKRIQEMQEQLHMRKINKDLVQCPKCKTKFAGEAGQVQAQSNRRGMRETGVNGQPVSYKAMEHKAANRYRCPRCKPTVEFCKKCGVVPYHLGFDCESYKKFKESRKCRFCEDTLTPHNTARPEYMLGPGLNGTVCNQAECIKKRQYSCDKVLPCGHLCCGIRDEKNCLPCLQEDCQKDKSKGCPAEDYCNICWTDGLGMAPCVELQCGHMFHYGCVKEKLSKKWPGARITFNFLECPLCKKEIKTRGGAFHKQLHKVHKLKKVVEKKAVERIDIEKCGNDKRLKDPNSRYYRNKILFAMDRFAFYKCHKCRQPYFGGMRRCEEAGANAGADHNKEHLICGSCASGPNAKTCKVHGKQFITYKCKFCCDIGRWFCWGNTHFCDKCHSRQEKGDYLNRKPISALPKCPGARKCPLAKQLGLGELDHPPNGTKNFSLGCIVCLRR